MSSSTLNSLWQVGADGSNPHAMLEGWRGAANSANGNWTPDGKYFLFQAVRNGRSDIWALREKGDPFHKVSQEPLQLTAGPMSFYSPSLAPTARRSLSSASSPALNWFVMRQNRDSLCPT